MKKWLSVIFCLSGHWALVQAQALESQDVGPEVEVVQYPPSQSMPSETLSEETPSQIANESASAVSEPYSTTTLQKDYYSAPSQPNSQIKVPLVDSIAVYTQLIEKYDTKGQRLKGKGSAFLISGIALSALGVVMMVKGIDEMDCSESDEYEDGFYYETNSERNNCNNAEMFVFGYLTAFIGAGGITTGIILKAIGGKSLRNAKRYERSLENYQTNRGVYSPMSFQMNLIPVVDAREGRAGAQLSLLF